MKSNEYYGSDSGMPQEILDKRLADAQKLVVELTEENRRRAAFTDSERLADRLHRLLHLGIDCDFYYSNWPLPNGCRSKFLSTAIQINSLNIADDVREQLMLALERAR